MSPKKSSATTRHEADEEQPHFPRPDAETAARGAPPHEQASAPNDRERPDEERHVDDRRHGYTQDSGYPGSGGYDDPRKQPVQTARARHERSPLHDGHAESDEKIRRDLQRALTPDRTPRGSHIVVSISSGVVTLEGEVAHDAARRRIADLVRGVESVRELRNRLNLRAGKGAAN